MARSVTAFALIFLTLNAWDLPDCPFCGQHDSLASSFDDSVDFGAIEFWSYEEVSLERLAAWIAPQPTPRAPIARACLTVAPKQGPPTQG